jgi:hypothetical protein
MRDPWQGTGSKNEPRKKKRWWRYIRWLHVAIGTLALTAIAFLLAAGLAYIDVGKSTEVDQYTEPSPLAGQSAPSRAPEPTLQSKTVNSARATEPGVIALAGIGAVLVMAAAFYTRISKITLPGGGGIELTALKVADAVTEAATRKKDTTGKTLTPKQIARASSRLAAMIVTDSSVRQASLSELAEAAIDEASKE